MRAVIWQGVIHTEQRYVEILCFQLFTPFTIFTKDGPDFGNKVLKEIIEVLVVLDLGFEVECVDTSGDSNSRLR